MNAGKLIAVAMCVASVAHAEDNKKPSTIDKVFMTDQYIELARRKCGITEQTPTAGGGEWAAERVTQEHGRQLIEAVVAVFEKEKKELGMAGACQEARQMMADIARQASQGAATPAEPSKPAEPTKPPSTDPQAVCLQHVGDIQAWVRKSLVELDRDTLHGRRSSDPDLTICDVAARINIKLAPENSDAHEKMALALALDPSMRGWHQDQFLIRHYPDGAWRFTEVPQRDIVP